jgi:LPXTG-site transpeptidase (sortase) family protein
MNNTTDTSQQYNSPEVDLLAFDHFLRVNNGVSQQSGESLFHAFGEDLQQKKLERQAAEIGSVTINEVVVNAPEPELVRTDQFDEDRSKFSRSDFEVNLQVAIDTITRFNSQFASSETQGTVNDTVDAHPTVSEKGKSVVEKFTPRRSTKRVVGKLAIVTVLSGAAIVGSVLGEMSIDSDDDKTEESVDADDLAVSAKNTTAIDSESMPLSLDTATLTGAITLEPTASEVEEIVEVAEEVDQDVMDAIMDIVPAVSKPNHPPLTAEQQAIVDQEQKTLLEMVAGGEYTLEGIAGNRVGSITIDGICLDDIDVYVTNAVDPVNNPAILDGFDWSTLSNDPTLPPVTMGDYEAARERLNPLYRARLDESPQEPCVMEGQSEYQERWLLPTKGSEQARATATNPSDLEPAATLHPLSSLPGQSGVTLIEAHRTTENAAFVNVDALIPGQTVEFSDEITGFSYDFVGFKDVSPDISIDEIRAMYEGDDDVLILSTCDDGSAIRLLTIFKRTV